MFKKLNFLMKVEILSAVGEIKKAFRGAFGRVSCLGKQEEKYV